MYKSFSTKEWEYKNDSVTDVVLLMNEKTHFQILCDGAILTIL